MPSLTSSCSLRSIILFSRSWCLLFERCRINNDEQFDGSMRYTILCVFLHHRRRLCRRLCRRLRDFRVNPHPVLSPSPRAAEDYGLARRVARPTCTQHLATRPRVFGVRGKKVSEAVLTLLKALNSAFANESSRPDWMLTPTDANLKTAGRYDPGPHEWDHGNFAGSILVLAMLDANKYFEESTPVLNIFGTESLREKGSTRPRSGKGPDNRRTNAIEALLNHLQQDANATTPRQRILNTWRFVGIAVACTEVWRREVMPHACVSEVLGCPDDWLPPLGVMSDQEVAFLEQVLDELGTAGSRKCGEGRGVFLCDVTQRGDRRTEPSGALQFAQAGSHRVASDRGFLRLDDHYP